MAAYTWLGNNPNVTVTTGYTPNGLPGVADTVVDNTLGSRPTIGTSNALSWDVNGRTDYNSVGDDAAVFNGFVWDSTDLGDILLVGQDVFAGGIKVRGVLVPGTIHEAAAVAAERGQKMRNRSQL
jgi:hypothetical protein